MRKTTKLVAMCGMLFLSGCGESPEVAMRGAYRPNSYKDVTTSPEYNFSPFVGVVWRTKVKVAVADVKTYTGVFEPTLLAPIHFDATTPDYTPGTDTRKKSILAPGARLQIERLMKDQGAWGGVKVRAFLLEGTNVQAAVYLDGALLARNKWSGGGLHAGTNWGVNPEMLEQANGSSSELGGQQKMNGSVLEK